MLAAETQEQIRVDHFAEMTQPFILVEPWEWRARGRTAGGERIGAIPMWNPTLPLQLPAAVAPESRNHIAELRMHAAAVIALVVVLDDDLPVRRHVVANRVTHTQPRQRIAMSPLRNRAELLRQRV